MERRLTAMRDVLLHIETHMPFTGELRQLITEELASDCSQEEIRYAIYLMLDRGYLDGVWEPGKHNPAFPLIRAITFDGYEFLEMVRNPQIQSVLDRAMEETGVWSVDALKPVAQAVIEEKLEIAVAGALKA